jgi:UrcA family protein
MAIVANATRAAEPGDITRQKVVSYKDLNLSSTEGVAVLYKRIQRAAVEVCGDYDSFSLSRQPSVRACIDQATSQAIAKIDSPMLTSLYLAKTGKTAKQVAANAPTH